MSLGGIGTAGACCVNCFGWGGIISEAPDITKGDANVVLGVVSSVTALAVVEIGPVKLLMV